MPYTGPPKRSLVVFLLWLLGLANSGCSFLFVDRPPDNHRELAAIDCTEGRGWPVTDAVFTGLYAISSVAGAATDKTEDSEGNEKTVPIGARVATALTLAGLAALHGTSAVYGFSNVSTCREAQRDLVARRGMPASSFSGKSAGLARVTTRSGQVVEGHVLGDVLVARPPKQDGSVNTLNFAVVQGSDIAVLDSRGPTLWKYPAPAVRTWLVSNRRGFTLGIFHAVLILATGTAGDASELTVAAETNELEPGHSVAGEVIVSENGRRVQLVPTIRVETPRGIVAIPVSDLVDGTNAGLAPSATPSATSSAPVLQAGPPPASDWTTEYRGVGGLTVTVNNGATIPVFVKIRDPLTRSTAAQVPVAAGQTASVRLGTGNFEVLMRAEMDGRYRYFKGDPIFVPPNATGTALLTVGIQGSGEALEEIDGEEFNR